MKKSWLSAFVLLMTTGFASAALSLSDMLDSIDSSLIILSSIFIISFLFFYFSLSKIFKAQKNFASIISVVLSFLIIYGVNKVGFDVENFFFDMGVSEDALMTIIPLILVAGIIFMFVKFKTKAFYYLGGLLVVLGFFIFEEAAQLIVIGVVIIIVGMIITPTLRHMGISIPKTYKDTGAGI
jgi:hypothetical protein